MRPSLLLLVLLTLCIADATAAPRADTTFVMSDGVPISVSYIVPTSPRPAAGYPALVLAHGFGQSKESYLGLASLYADSGYFALTYTMRGQGIGANSSGGQFTFFTGERELEDCREIIEWIRRRGDVNPERVGIEGQSQGGEMAWGAAIERMNLRCAVPIIAVPHYVRSVTANGCINHFFQTILQLARSTNLVRLAPFLRDSLLPAFEADRYSDAVALLGTQELEGRVPEIEIPIFLQCAWQDDIFAAREAFRAFSNVRSEKKLMLWPGPHALAGAYETERRDLTFRFYRRWLRDDAAETIMHRDSALLLIDAGNGEHRWLRAGDSATYIAEYVTASRRRLYLSGSGRLDAVPPSTPLALSMLYVQNVTNDAYVFRSEPLTEPFTMIGAHTAIVANSTGMRYQVNVLLWDYDPVAGTWRAITQGCRQERLTAGEPRSRRRVEYDLSQQLYTIPAGHRLEARVKFGMPLSKPADEFGRTPVPPQETAIDTIFSSIAEPSYIELIPFVAPTPSAVPEERTAAIDLSVVLASEVVGEEEDIRVTMTGPEGDYHLRLHDLSGATLREVTVTKPEGSWVITMPGVDLPAGIYIVRIAHGGASAAGRFLRVR